METSERYNADIIESIFRTSKKTIQEYVREIDRHCRFKSCVHPTIKGTVLDDRGRLIDLYDACVQQDAHLASTLQTLESQILGERYMLAKQSERGKYIKDVEESKKIQGTQFGKIIKGIVYSKLYGYTALEIVPEVDGYTKRLREVNFIERRNVLPDQRRIVKRQGIWSPGWDFDDPAYQPNYVLITSGDLGLFSATTPSILAKKFTMANYVNFSHTYGQPIIHGKTDSENIADRKRLANDIASAAQNKVIVTGLTDEVEIKSFAMVNSERIFTELIEMVDKDVSNLILGSESMAGETQSYVGSTRAHQDIFRDRVEVYREYIENVMNEEIIPRLVRMGFIKPGLEFKYSNRLDMSTTDQISLYNFLTDKYEISADEIEKTFGVIVGKQINLERYSSWITTSTDGEGERRGQMSDSEYAKRYGVPREDEEKEKDDEGDKDAGEDKNEGSGEKKDEKKKAKDLLYPMANAASDVVMSRKEEDFKEKHREEYLELLAVFERLVKRVRGNSEPWEVMEELMALRADFAIQHALRGFNLDYEKGLELLKKADKELTDDERAKRDIVVAAVDNLIDFAVAEEYSLCDECGFLADFDENEGWTEEDVEEWMQMCNTYNNAYASVEDQDIEHAMMVAGAIYALSDDTLLIYMTQGDNRVRPWHLQYEGYTAPKSLFPQWLVPPIEHQCRCYLDEMTTRGKLRDIVMKSQKKTPEIPDWFNPTFKESVAFGGRIFSDEHAYFKTEMSKKNRSRLDEIAARIKKEYGYGKDDS